MTRRPPHLAPLLALVLLAGCFEEPVQEELEIRFAPDGKARVSLATTFLYDDDQDDNPLLRARIEEERRRILLGEDDWSPRFERMRPASRRSVFEREDGILTEARQTAEVDLADDPDALSRFLSDTLVNAFYVAEDGWAELSLYPLAPGRASRGERQRYERAVGPWTGSIARYLKAASTLYGYLDEHPDRAEIAFSVLLEDVLPEEDGGRRPLLSADEEELVEAVEDAMEDTWSILLVESRESYSLNEISRLVHDPFPARVRVEPGGAPDEVEGFVPDRNGLLAVPGISLWEALESLEGAWLEPDPLLLYVSRSGGLTGTPGAELTLEEIVARERRAADPAPDAEEIRARIEAALEPAPVYRVLWSL
ncbi:MAG: hypothetical protein PVG07_02375 [Acidobacteriota bacterium]